MFSKPKIETPPPPPKPAFAAQNPSAVNSTPYNPLRTPFAQFRMSPYLSGFAPKTAGRPSLVRSRP